jgi:hypothetical protein
LIQLLIQLLLQLLLLLQALASKENRPNPPEQPRDIDEPESAARHQSVT